MNREIKKDFGIVNILPTGDLYSQIKDYMSKNGYDTKYNDVCAVECDRSSYKDIALFKFVSVRALSSELELYYKIEFCYPKKNSTPISTSEK
jgi:hypothetical protein